MFWDHGQQMFRVLVRFQIVGLCCLCDTVDHSGCLCSVYGINDFPVLLSDAEATDGTLRSIIIHRNISIIQKYPEIFFLIQKVGKSSFQLAFYHDLFFFLFQVRKQSIYQWPDDHLTLRKSFFRREIFQFTFFPVDRLDLFHYQPGNGFLFPFGRYDGKGFLELPASMHLIRELE